jgi:hypothetical protein
MVRRQIRIEDQPGTTAARTQAPAAVSLVEIAPVRHDGHGDVPTRQKPDILDPIEVQTDG